MLQKLKERNIFLKVDSDHFEINTISYITKSKTNKNGGFFSL